jgi:hypothetical protein
VQHPPPCSGVIVPRANAMARVRAILSARS